MPAIGCLIAPALLPAAEQHERAARKGGLGHREQAVQGAPSADLADQRDLALIGRRV